MSLEDADAGNSATSKNDLKALLREVLAADPSLLQPAADNSGGRGPNQGKYLGNYNRTRPEVYYSQRQRQCYANCGHGVGRLWL